MNPFSSNHRVRAFNLILAVMLLPGMVFLVNRAPERSPLKDTLPVKQPPQPVVARIGFSNQGELATLAQKLDIWEVNHEQRYLIALLSPSQQQELQQAGYTITVDVEKTALLFQSSQNLPGQVSGIPGFPCYRTVEETYADLASIAANHADLARWVKIGASWDQIVSGGSPGYDLNVLVLTNTHIPGPKPIFFLMAAIHGREYATTETATRFAEYLVNQYNIDPDVTWLMDHSEIHILAVTNPDGRKLAETGLYWRKNTDSDDGCSDPYAWGTDLNRNSSFMWGGSGASGNPCDETFRGPEAASEPETQALQNYVASIFPDQRGPNENDAAPETTMGTFITLHSYGDLVLWPWGWSSTLAPNSAQLQTLGRKLAYFNQYTPEQAVALYPTTGSSDDWAYGELGIAAYTFEIGNTFFQDCETFNNTIYSHNREALLYAFKAARRPYQNPAGPDSLNLSLSSPVVAADTPVNLTAIADDTRYRAGSGEPVQTIAAVRYSIDQPSWESGAILQPMEAADGIFDNSLEVAQAQLETFFLTPGRHIIFVESQDANGDWGVPSAIFLTLLDPDTTATIEGLVRSASDNAPLGAWVTTEQFSASSDPANGFYSMQVLSGTFTISAGASGYLTTTTQTLTAIEKQTIHQDIYLAPYCEILSSDFESGSAGWNADSPWAITTETAHSPSHAWSDSPNGNYGDNIDVSLTPPPLDLSTFDNVQLQFWQQYNLEQPPVYDFAYLETSTDGGSYWEMAAAYSGRSNGWVQEQIDLKSLAYANNARLRFRLKSDSGVNADGWYIDDVNLQGTGSNCFEAIPPTANFNSDSPVPLGQALHFYDQTTGTPPFDYDWDFGDGIGSAGISSPQYTYAHTGTFTVTLNISNTLGSSTSQQLVVVEPQRPISITQVSLQQVYPDNPLAGQNLYLRADLFPDNASKPYTYTLDYGDGTLPITQTSSYDPLTFSHVYTSSGTFPLDLTVWNDFTTLPVSTTMILQIAEPPGPPPEIYLPFVLR